MMKLRRNLFNIVVATLVTLVLWTFAAEKTRLQVQASGQVVIQVPAGSFLYVDPPSALPINVKLSGSQQSVRRFESALASTVVLTPAMLGVPAAPSDEVSVDLRSALGRTQEAMEGDIVIESVSPPQVRLRLGELLTVPARIVAQLPPGQLLGEPTIDPPEASVVLPREASQMISGMQLEAEVPLRNLEAGRRHSVDAELRLPESLGRWREFVRVAPARARVVFTLRSNTRSFTIPVVPVQISGPPEDLAGYLVTLKPSAEFLRDVQVTGPTEAIAQIEAGRIPVAALIHLSADDLARRVESAPVTLWLLPPGVTVAKIGESAETAPGIGLTIAPSHR